MYKGKHAKKNKHRLTPLVILTFALVLTLSVGGTVALLFTATDPVENIFVPARLYTEVQEDFDQEVKENVVIRNGVTIGDSFVPSEADVYIRVALIPTWEDDDGNVIALSASLKDLNIIWGADWYEHTDGFYYFTEKVAAGDSTGELIVSAEVDKSSNGYKAGYHMNLQILAQSIQAEPITAVTEAWGFVPDGSN